MPAERTRASGRGGSDCNQLVWTNPVEMSTPNPNSIAFTTNLTPVTFNDPPPMVEIPYESTLFPPLDDCPSSRRPVGHSKKKPENYIPRPPNAFILFRSSFIKSQHVSTEVETNHSTLSKIIGLTWQNLPDDERQVWHAKAKAALDEHKRKFPQYAFKPLHSKSRGPDKRKVREVGPKDLKRCAKIAELLVEGKKGQELDVAIQEFDKHHVPEVVTRFEAPLTARMYRRSSSAPIPDTEHSNPPFVPSSSSPSRKARASSSQPTRQPTPAAPLIQEEQPTQADHATLNPSPTPSLEPYSFPSTPDPSFNFNTFSFDTTSSPVPVYECDPLTNDNAFDGIFARQQHTASPSLSVDTSISFLDDWTRSSSPVSSMPATPQSYLQSPSPTYANDFFSPNPTDLTGGFDLESFTKSLEDYPPLYSENWSCSPFNQQFDQSLDVYSSSFGSFEQEHSKPESVLAQFNVDFSAFMASLTPCSL